MRPADNIRKSFRKLKIPTSPGLDEKIYNEISRVCGQKDKPAALTLWRIIMKSNITKFAAAAMITLTTIIVFNQLDVSIDVAGIALADVAKKIGQTKNCAFNKTTIIFSEDNKTNTFDSSVYYTKAAVREDIYDDGKITNQIYVKFSDGILIGIDHTRRMFRKIDLSDEDIEKEKLSFSISPENIVNLILSKGEYTKLGRKTVDGVLSEGFEFNDKRALLSIEKDKLENIVTRLWINVNTNLPVRIEVDAVLVNKLKANVVMDNPEWDIELEEDFFEPKIPDSYITPEQRRRLRLFPARRRIKQGSRTEMSS
jgi:hypothetical protein